MNLLEKSESQKVCYDSQDLQFFFRNLSVKKCVLIYKKMKVGELITQNFWLFGNWNLWVHCSKKRLYNY